METMTKSVIDNPQGIILVERYGTGFNDGDYTYGQEFLPVVYSTVGQVVEWERRYWCNSDFTYCPKCGTFGEWHECNWEYARFDRSGLLKAIGNARYYGTNRHGQGRFDATK